MILFSGYPPWPPDHPRIHRGPALLHHASGHDPLQRRKTKGRPRPISLARSVQLPAKAPAWSCRGTTKGMDLHLKEIAQAVALGAHAAVLLDRAGWHVST